MADRRYRDALVLRDTGQNARANGAMYLAGIALELLLKALLLEKHPWLQRPDGRRRTRAEGTLFELCYVKHDLEALLAVLTDLRAKLANVQSGRLLQTVRSLAVEWTIHIRYSTQQADITDARRYLDRLAEVRAWLK